MTGLLLHEGDNVAVVTRAVARGEMVEAGGEQVVALQDIPALHKIALADIPKGAHVHKYGYSVGISEGIRAGEHVHTHNLVSGLKREDEYEYTPRLSPAAAYENREFYGYRRADGRVGARNQILVLPTVGCINNVCEEIARIARERCGYADICAAVHPYGCSQLHDDLEGTRRILAGLGSNPNNGGVLVVSLGCENNTLKEFLPCLSLSDPSRLRILRAQEAGDEIEAGVALVSQLAELVKADKRVPCRLSDLTVGLKCGGSDALSGVTANPVVGALADKIVGAGGNCIMTEIPEMFGAEQLLLCRCADRDIFGSLADVIQDFKKYFTDHGESVGENPSPGNKEGGITTLEEKSLGCVLKGGHSPVCGVVRYGGTVSAKGLTVLEAPGNDGAAATALAAAGAQVVLFTTGRGTPLGTVVPTLKIATNRSLAENKPKWIDYDASRAFEIGVDGAAEELMEVLLKTAGGQTCKAEKNNSREIAVWKRGVTL